jgi:phosphatidylglycerophosphate synthase
LRGLFWAGIGLAIYPRGTKRVPLAADVAAEPKQKSAALVETRVLLYVPRDPAITVSPEVRLAGLAIGERVVRSALRAGYTRVIVFDAPSGTVRSRLFDSLARQVNGVTVAKTAEEWRRAVGALDPAQAVTLIGAGTVVSPALLTDAAALAAEPGLVKDVPAGEQWPVSGVVRLTAAEALNPAALGAMLSPRWTNASRPTGIEVSHGLARLAIRMIEPRDIASAEQTIRRSIFKDTDATVARFNRRISLPISIALIPTPLTANQLSVILVFIGFYSGWLFSIGHYWPGVLAGFLSLAASILDGCDGEIARLKYQESALGCWIETVGDYSYYIAIFIGLTFGAARQTGWPIFYWVGTFALVGTLLTFAILIYLRARITAGQPTRLHAVARERFQADPSLWTRISWSIGFIATRAAMPYGIMFLALVNFLPLVIVLAAIGSNAYWITLVMKLRDLMRDDEETVAA